MYFLFCTCLLDQGKTHGGLFTSFLVRMRHSILTGILSQSLDKAYSIVQLAALNFKVSNCILETFRYIDELFAGKAYLFNS